jgi:hypothetical protein
MSTTSQIDTRRKSVFAGLDETLDAPNSPDSPAMANADKILTLVLKILAPKENKESATTSSDECPTVRARPHKSHVFTFEPEEMNSVDASRVRIARFERLVQQMAEQRPNLNVLLYDNVPTPKSKQ